MGLLKFYYNPYYLGYTHVKNNNKGSGHLKCISLVVVMYFSFLVFVQHIAYIVYGLQFKVWNWNFSFW